MDFMISALKEYSSLQEFLRLGLDIPLAQVKKYKEKIPSILLKRPVQKGQTFELPLDLLNRGQISPSYFGPDIPILFENEHFLAIDKPPRVHGHSLVYTEKDNVFAWIREKGVKSHLKVLEVNPNSHERGLLYRLDHGTSGVLIMAKNQFVWDEIRSHFSEIVREKKYTLLCQGKFNEKLLGEHVHYLYPVGDKGKLQKAIADFKKVPQKMKTSAQEARLKITNFQYDSIQNTSLIHVELITGLRHQIRAQFQALGYPLLGDLDYGGPDYKRICLHATEYFLKSENFSLKIFSPTPF